MANVVVDDYLNMAAKTLSAPAIIRGFADLSTFAGVSKGALANDTLRTANGVALQAALDWCAANGKYAELPDGVYDYLASATQNGNNAGLHVKKDVPGLIMAGEKTTLVQRAVNHPILTIGDIGANNNDSTRSGIYRAGKLTYGASQAGQAQASGLLLGRVWDSEFSGNWQVDKNIGYGDFAPYIGFRFGVANGQQFFFQNVVDRLTCTAAQAHLLRFYSGSTGNVFDSGYFGGGTFGSRGVCSGEAISFRAPGSAPGVFKLLNIEWTSAATMMFLDSCSGLLIDYMHVEGCQLTGGDPAVILASASRLQIGQLDLIDVWIAGPAATGFAFILKTDYQARVDINNLYPFWNNSGYNPEAVQTLTTQVHKPLNAATPGSQNAVRIRNMDKIGGTGTFHIDNLIQGAAFGAAGYIGSFAEYKSNKTMSTTEGANIVMGNANMTVYGQHREAKVTASVNLSAARTLTLSDKLRPSGAGAASVRRSGDLVEVHRTGAGAFDLVVADHAAATLYTFVGAASAGTSKTFEWTGSAWVAL